MVGYIYKYENLINHKVYIGQTIDLNARRASHVYKAKTVKNKFYNAVRKYGWEGFDYSVIAQIEAEDIKESKEQAQRDEEEYWEGKVGSVTQKRGLKDDIKGDNWQR